MNNKNNHLYLRKFGRLHVIGFLIVLSACVSNKNTTEEFCTEADFVKMDKIDAHCHINTKEFGFMEQAKADNFQILTINTDALMDIEEQQDIAIYEKEAFPDRLEYLTTFLMDGWNDDDWLEKTMTYLDESFKKGAIGVKVWKNIGMEEMDKNDKFIMIDDPKFDPIFSYLAKNNIPVCGHLGEPKNCWLAIDLMTVNNDKLYYKDHPQYHMYLHPEYPSYEDQIAARDSMLGKHPDLKFMGAHLGSMEWSVDLIANHLDKYPNLNLDMADRICHIQIQTQGDRQKVSDFFVKYQDRILYGTDRGNYSSEGQNKKEIKENAHKQWMEDWMFFTSEETLSSWKVEGEFKGLKLPKSVVEKIYYQNAIKMFPEFRN